MSVKILAFGEAGQVGQFLDRSQGEGHSQEEAVIAENVKVAEQNYLLFAVKDRQLVSEQAAGTNGTHSPTQALSSSSTATTPSRKKSSSWWS